MGIDTYCSGEPEQCMVCKRLINVEEDDGGEFVSGTDEDWEGEYICSACR